MKLEIVTKNIKNESVARDYIQRKVNDSIERLKGRVDRLIVRLQDETRDKAVFDGLCSIEAELNPRGSVHVSCNGDSVFDCISQATDKLEAAVRHEVDRQRQPSRARHQQGKREFLESLADDAAE